MSFVPTPRSLVRAALAILVGLGASAVVAGCTATEAPASSSPPASSCDALARCCDSVGGPTASQCRSNVETYRGQAGAEDSCKSALASFEASGTCSSSGGANDGGLTTGLDRALCNAYIACAAITTPKQAGTVDAAYGSNGTCWKTNNEAICLEECREKLHANRVAFPDVDECRECTVSADCVDVWASPSGRACNTEKGLCVECTDDSTCSGGKPACDVVRHACVECTSTEHCKGGTCNVSSHACD